jgi:xanthine/CO dehydrogenase XdhC/CoxF family maturation factor
VFAPCGLDIGSSTVEETAVAILGEIIASRAGRPGGALRDGSGPIRRDRASGDVAEGERRGTSSLAWQAKP